MELGHAASRAEPPSFLVELIAPFGIVNTYGLFAVMTTEREEIIVQGSNDRTTCLNYEFASKPGEMGEPAIGARISRVWIGKCGSQPYRDTAPSRGS